MKLAPKLSLTVLIVVAPLVAIFSLMRWQSLSQTNLERRVERAALDLSLRPLKNCGRKARTWSRSRRGWEAFAYDADLYSIHPRAPKLDPALRDGLDEQKLVTQSSFWPWSPKRAIALTRVSVGSDCEYVAVFAKGPRRALPSLRPLWLPVLLFVAALALTGFAIAWPLVSRIRKLTAQMLSTSEEHPKVHAEQHSSDEIGDIARAFNVVGNRVQQTVASLRERDQALTSYISNTSHDLAIPLSVLQHRLSRAQTSIQDHEQDPEAQEHLRYALEETSYMAALVRNLNINAKLDAKGSYFAPENIDLNDLVRRIRARFETLANTREVQFNVSLPEKNLISHCDAILAEQAINNVVQNAIQYTHPKGHVALLLESEGENEFTLRVIDDGPGIPESALERILERGQREQSARQRNPEGSGLGLSICRRVCDLHQWTLHLENQNPGLSVTMTGRVTAV